MFEIVLNARKTPIDKSPLVKAMVPALPREGDHISHDKAGISGYVKRVMFWWDEKGKLHIEVTLS